MGLHLQGFHQILSSMSCSYFLNPPADLSSVYLGDFQKQEYQNRPLNNKKKIKNKNPKD